MALTIAGRKSHLLLRDFVTAASTMGLENRIVLRLVENMYNSLPKWTQLIDESFLSDEMKSNYMQMITSRLERLQ